MFLTRCLGKTKPTRNKVKPDKNVSSFEADPKNYFAKLVLYTCRQEA